MIDELFLQVIGGVVLLLCGVRLTGQGFELAFGARLKGMWSAPARGRFGRARPFIAGAIGTGLLQSSGAVVALLVSFAEISPLPLTQSLYAVLGADIGSTVIVQVLSFRVYRFAFPVVSLGGLLYLAGRKASVRAVGQGILGFGLILLSLEFLSEAAAAVGSVSALRTFTGILGEAPLVAFVLGVGLSALFQSGTAVLIVLIAYPQQGSMPVEAVLPFVLGANVGGSTAAYVAAAGLAAEGRRVALGHILMKTAGALLFLPFYSVAQRVLAVASPDPSRIVANAHTLFNVTLAALFFFLVPRLAAALEKAAATAAAAPGWKPLYLDREHLPVAGAALGQVAREIIRIADMIQEMHELALGAVLRGSAEAASRISKIDDDVDRLTREIKVFLSALGEGALDPEQTRRAVAYIGVVTDLENVGDVLDKTIGDHARRLAERSQHFSEEGAKELETLLLEVDSMYREAVSAFVTRDRKAADIVVRRQKAVGQMERELRLAHIRRLQKGTPESLESSAAHLDILSSGKVIASHCASIAYGVLRTEG